MAARGELGGGVAVTVMSNFGFHRAMEEAGIEVAVTKVGDRYVLDELRERGWALGGEQSGHIIDTRFVATGDGIAAALATMRELGGRELADAVPMEKLPQTLVNVEVADREAIDGADGCLGGGRARGRRARGPRPGPAAPLGNRAAGAGDGRGAERRGGGRGLRAPGRRSSAKSSPEPAGRRLPLIAFYVRNRRICGGRPCRDLLVAGLEKLEYRGYDSAGVSVIEDGRVDSVRAVGNLANLRAAMERARRGRRRGRRCRPAGDDRRRPHPLGDPRAGHRGERPPAQRQLRPGPHRPQRDRREPRQATPRASRPKARSSARKPTPRSSPT